MPSRLPVLHPPCSLRFISISRPVVIAHLVLHKLGPVTFPLATMSTRRSARIQASQSASPTVAEPKSISTKTAAAKKAKSSALEVQAPAKKRSRAKSSDTATQVPTKASNKKAKASTEPANDEPAEFKMPETPTSKRRKAANGQAGESPTKPPPFTPTPSAVGFIAAGSSPISNGDDANKPRLAEPHATNAPLSTPGGSRVVAYTSDVPETNEVAPAEDAGMTLKPTTTTENLLEQACAHLIKVDPRLKTVIEQHPCKIFSPEGLQEEVNPFESLVRSILAQQVSGAAANSIKNKFIALFPNPTSSPKFFPSPSQVAAADISLLRTAGLSQRKAEYVTGLAAKFAAGELSAKMLVEASDAEVLEKLTAVRGLGQWSVEMFTCFALKRMDVFSTGDLGVQRGMAAWLGKDVQKLKTAGKGGKWKYLSEKEMLEHSAKFAPYRVENVNIDAVQGS